MKSSHSNTNKNQKNISWESSILELSNSKKPSQSVLKLIDAGFSTLEKLVEIIPLRSEPTPELSSFADFELDKLFLGKANIIATQATPAFGKRGKGKIQLFNISATVKDFYSDRHVNLKWFNTYPSFQKSLPENEFTFMGTVQEYRGIIQIVNPKLSPKEAHNNVSGRLIEYPTVATVPGKYTKGLIEKIPNELWGQKNKNWDPVDTEKLKNISMSKTYQCLHGISDELSFEEAKNRIIYNEFFLNQLKVKARKAKARNIQSNKIEISVNDYNSLLELFPYDLTPDQSSVMEEIKKDLNSKSPMMRMIQGDVGCGKTTVAILSALICIKNKFQSALMCPTEALATQHYETLKTLIGDKYTIELLVGSTKVKVKDQIYADLKLGKVDFVIGTHALIQEGVEFRNLGLAIIDEQHKFGVNQRLNLLQKGDGVNSLIMSATPIPRTLQLAQFGDLDISTIRTLPGGRKGIKTRIVTPQTYEKYLCFLKTRIELGEQIYIVVPAIEESEAIDLKNVMNHMETYTKFFPEYKIQALHGQLSSDEKNNILKKFENNEVQILISTTVIEVGINILNSTVMAIYDPDRFGLSSLHQLRGRVGRGDKPGFCFLITDHGTSEESKARLKVIEKSIDGFEIAEADLKIRGMGDLFGVHQSGHGAGFKIANIIEHFKIFEKVSQDIVEFEKEYPELLNNALIHLSTDKKVSATI